MHKMKVFYGMHLIFLPSLWVGFLSLQVHELERGIETFSEESQTGRGMSLKSETIISACLGVQWVHTWL